MQQCEGIWHDSMRRGNSIRKEPAYRTYYKQAARKIIENVFSGLTALMPKRIHATTIKGFLLKIKLFIYSYTFNNLAKNKVAT